MPSALMGGGRCVPACRAIFAVRNEGLGWGVEMSRPERFMSNMSGRAKRFQIFSPWLNFFSPEVTQGDFRTANKPSKCDIAIVFMRLFLDLAPFRILHATKRNFDGLLLCHRSNL